MVIGNSSNNRREFLKKVSAGMIGIPAIGAGEFPKTSRRGNTDTLEFYLDENLVYLNTGSLGPSPKWLVDRINGLNKELESNPVSENWGNLGKEMELVRGKAAEFISCSEDEIILTRNTTEGLSMVSSTLQFPSGTQILTTNHEHGGGEVGLDYRNQRDGIEVKKLELPLAASSSDQVISTVLSQIKPTTRLLLLSHVSTITGMIMPLMEISNELEGSEIFFLADGAQACGMIDVNVGELGVDAYATSGHKWLMGPKETGLLYLSTDKQELIKPIFTQSGYQSYSASSGTRNVANFIALGEMLDWHRVKGPSVIEGELRSVANYCYDRLLKVEGIQLISPADQTLRSAMISAILQEKANRDAYQFLSDRNIIVKVLPKYNALRFSTHLFNSTKDVDNMIAGLEEFLGS